MRGDLRERGIIRGVNQYTDRLIPPRQTMDSWIKLFEETGSMGRRPYSRERTALATEVLEAIDRAVEESPIEMSQRRISNSTTQWDRLWRSCMVKG